MAPAQNVDKQVANNNNTGSQTRGGFARRRCRWDSAGPTTGTVTWDSPCRVALRAGTGAFWFELSESGDESDEAEPSDSSGECGLFIVASIPQR